MDNEDQEDYSSMNNYKMVVVKKDKKETFEVQFESFDSVHKSSDDKKPLETIVEENSETSFLIQKQHSENAQYFKSISVEKK